jgi:ferredoxin
MIVARRKPLEEIEANLQGFSRVLVVGCGTCMAVCQAGGEKEVEILATQLRMRARLVGCQQRIDEITLLRQCEREFFEPLSPVIRAYDALLSAACGAGVQFLAERFQEIPVFPALDTLFLGVTETPGVWAERCSACGKCLLDQTGGICPLTMCAKGLLNGPCGGTNRGKCEVDPGKDCAWTLIYRRLERLGRLDLIERIAPPRDHDVILRPGRYSLQSVAEESSSD